MTTQTIKRYTTELSAQYSSRQSFYSKAMVRTYKFKTEDKKTN